MITHVLWFGVGLFLLIKCATMANDFKKYTSHYFSFAFFRWAFAIIAIWVMSWGINTNA